MKANDEHAQENSNKTSRRKKRHEQTNTIEMWMEMNAKRASKNKKQFRANSHNKIFIL